MLKRVQHDKDEERYMIAKLRGVIDSLGEDNCIIDVNGVGYLVFASSRTLVKLVKGANAALYIETVVREDSFNLYGFFEPLEKEWFLTLIYPRRRRWR